MYLIFWAPFWSVYVGKHIVNQRVSGPYVGETLLLGVEDIDI